MRAKDTAVEQTWHVYDSPGQIPALDSRESPSNLASCSLYARKRATPQTLNSEDRSQWQHLGVGRMETVLVRTGHKADGLREA